jgi:glycosyltransferase involved in cell wall biosynthesis
MNACDIFVLPSLNESFGVVNIEALACGKPVVASNVGGIPEILIDDAYGLLCEPGNPADLSKKIIQALNTDWDSQAIREYARHFAWDTVTKEILAVYGKYL